MHEINPYFWVCLFGCICAFLWPVDAQLFPVWLVLRSQLFFINTTLRIWAFVVWLKLPSPRPRWRFVPVQEREPLQ